MRIDMEADAPSRLDADVAVIGAGVAGITMARGLVAAGLRVVLLESGGNDYEAATAELNAGENVGLPYYPLDHARLRFFGGTTAIWGGRVAELDPIDFETRDWVPHSGWPLSHDDLAPWVAKARAVFGLPPRAPDAAQLRAAGVPLPAFSETEIATPVWSFDDQFDRFVYSRARDLTDHPRCTIVTHATVREIVASESGQHVERLEVVGLGGRRANVHARHYVLAAGGIENPRLLLGSRSVMPEGLGNQHDLVGRFFMEHPHARGGRIADAATWTWLKAFGKFNVGGTRTAAMIAASPSLQRREGLLNTSLTIAARKAPDASRGMAMRAYLHAKERADPDRIGRALWKSVKQVSRWVQGRTDPARPWLLNRMGLLDVALVVRAEQAPNPDSRVTLSRDVDAIGMPRPVLNWQTTPLDVASVAGLVHALDREAQRLGIGRVEPASWPSDPAGRWVTDPLISAHPIGGYHHIGTTRMSDDPRHGVTDAYGTVHGIANLHVAGSSLFPTSGWANPTLTVVALAMRSVEHIRRLCGAVAA